jgi:hypothetical protein
VPFKGAGPAVNEGFANDQLDFAYQGDLPSLIGRAPYLKAFRKICDRLVEKFL